jgi:hypothetical protein
MAAIRGAHIPAALMMISHRIVAFICYDRLNLTLR